MDMERSIFRQQEKKRSVQKRFQPRCAYCGETFRPQRKNQRYCKPSTERKLNCERKQALVGAVARQFRRYGWRARDLLVVARKCVEAAYEAVMAAMIHLGWHYDARDKVWLLREN